jgi:hypothetical protein
VGVHGKDRSRYLQKPGSAGLSHARPPSPLSSMSRRHAAPRHSSPPLRTSPTPSSLPSRAAAAPNAPAAAAPVMPAPSARPGPKSHRCALLRVGRPNLGRLPVPCAGRCWLVLAVVGLLDAAALPLAHASSTTIRHRLQASSTHRQTA